MARRMVLFRTMPIRKIDIAELIRKVREIAEPRDGGPHSKCDVNYQMVGHLDRGVKPAPCPLVPR